MPNRSQRRTSKRHQNLSATEHALHFHPDHYSLYQYYQMKRHSHGGMDSDNQEQYHGFLLQSNVDSSLIEFHEHKRLRMISIVDKFSNGLSSVYAFFDPDVPNAVLAHTIFYGRLSFVENLVCHMSILVTELSKIER